jgi:hypothetical protein
MLNFINKQKGPRRIHVLTFIKQNPLKKLLSGIEIGKKGAFPGPFEVDADKMIESFGKPIDNECFSDLPRPPQGNGLSVCGILPPH